MSAAHPSSAPGALTCAGCATPVALPGAATPLLLVEDSKLEQERMRAVLSGFGYRVITADDGEQALAALRHERVSLVLSDWRMPRLSGLDLCRALRREPSFGDPYVILVTGRNAKADLVAAMDAGADDFVSKPFNAEELRVRVQAGMRLLDLRRKAEARSAELDAALQREASTSRELRRDLAVAARMQRESLPTGPGPFPELEVGTLFRGAAQVAGDGYDFFGLDDRHLAFYAIDAAGHGVASAMLSFAVSRFMSPDAGAVALRHVPQSDAYGASSGLPGHIVPPDRVVHALNRCFFDKDDGQLYFTMVYGVVNVDSGRGLLCQAGHPHPLIVGACGEAARLGAGGFPVGMLEQATYESVAFRIRPGERLVIYSDGITDCPNSTGRRFGEKHLVRLLGEVHDRPLGDGIRSIEERLREWRGRTVIVDDISLLAIARRAAGASDERD